MLTYLVGKDICSTVKRDALITAADMSKFGSDEVVWPESLRRVSHLLGPAGFNRIGLQIDHIKLVDSPGRPLEAKAYLTGSYR